MADYTKTEHLGLDLYGDSDPADLRDGHNNNMNILDEKVSQNIDDITDVRGDVTAMQGDVNKIADIESSLGTLETEKASHNDLTTALALKADKTDTYSKSEVETKISAVNAVASAAAPQATTYTKMEVDNRLSAKVNSTDVYTKEETDSKIGGRKPPTKALLFGDSWTTIYSGQLANTLSDSPRFSEFHSFGVNGALMQDLSGQVDAATADTSFDNSQIETVIIVAGTNNVYHDNNLTSGEVNTVFAKFRSSFPHAEIHYFPNNSRTYNDGRSHRYAFMQDNAKKNGAMVHSEFLWCMWEDNFKYYSGIDAMGVQHLTPEGTDVLAERIIAAIDGAKYDTPVTFKVPVETDVQSTVIVGDGAVADVRFDGKTARFFLQASLTGWKDGANHKAPVVGLKFNKGATGITTPIVPPTTVSSAYLQKGSTGRNYYVATGFIQQKSGHLVFWAPESSTDYVISTIFVDITSMTDAFSSFAD